MSLMISNRITRQSAAANIIFDFLGYASGLVFWALISSLRGTVVGIRENKILGSEFEA
jgi:uncharacterized membrane protein